MNIPGLTATFDAGAAIAKYRIVKLGAADYAVIQGAAVTDNLIGVSTEVDIDSGNRADVITAGIATVEYGGNVTRGQKLTSDANGKAIAAAPANGVNNQVIGTALISGVDGDHGSVLINPHEIQGTA